MSQWRMPTMPAMFASTARAAAPPQLLRNGHVLGVPTRLGALRLTVVPLPFTNVVIYVVAAFVTLQLSACNLCRAVL